MKDLYLYDGPVSRFGEFVGNWCGYTWARSVLEAKKNLTFQYKREHHLVPSTRVEFKGVVQLVKNTKINDGEQLSFL